MQSETKKNNLRRDRPNNHKVMIATDDSCISLLQATTDLASILLGEEDLDCGVNQALEILGRSANADRLNVHQHQADPNGKTLGYSVVQYEWLSDYTDSQIDHPKLNRIPYDGLEKCYYLFCEGKHWGGLIDTLPEPFRSGQLKLGVKATYAIPIMVKRKYWGLIGLDFCRAPQQLDESTVAVIKTAATCIGNAIERARILQKQEEIRCAMFLQKQKTAVLAERDRLLDLTTKTAQALLNNQNLEQAIAKALQILGQGIETDRLVVMEHRDDSTGKSLGNALTLFEWHSSQAISQLHHPQLQQVSYEGVESWYEQLNLGKAVGGVIEELPEPLRSGQREIGVKSTYAVPITIDEKYWGLLAFDDCQVAKQRSETEICLLKTTAACIGSAIQQDRIRQERERAEQNILLEQQKAEQLAQHNKILKQRDLILVATAKAANILLTGENFDEAVDQALKIIGETLNTDRVSVIENWHNPSKPEVPHWRMLYEWDGPQIISQISHPELAQGSYEGIEDWYVRHSKGQSISCKLTEMSEPFRSGQEKLGVKVLHVVPIFIGGKHWGIIGFDDCHRTTNRNEAELSILKTVAACIGGAIERERSRQAKEEAEKAILLEREKAALENTVNLLEANQTLSLRDKWLEATANAANKLLQIANLDRGINAALRVLGESLNCDRVAVWQHCEDSQRNPAEFVRLLHEWSSANVVPQISHPKLNEISVAGIEDWFTRLKAGDWIGGAIDELKEPFRSSQIALGVQATYSVPIFVNNIYWGAIGIDFCHEPRRLTDPEIAVFKTAASCVGSAIYRQQIQTKQANVEKTIILERAKAAKKKARELTKVNALLNQSSIDLGNAQDLDSFLSQILQSISQQIGANTGHIFLYDEESNTLAKRLSVWQGKIYHGVAEHDCQLFCQPFSADITPGFQHLCQTRAIDLLSTSTGANLDLWWPETLEWHRRMGHQEAIAIALMIGNKPLGLLGLGFVEKTILSQEELDLLRALTNQGAIAIQLTILAEQSKKLALNDERNRMAREIHDTLAQAFTGISLQLEAAMNILETKPQAVQERLLRAKQLAKEGITEARRSVRALRPEVLEFSDLATALSQLVAKMIAGTEIATQFLIEGKTCSLDPEIELNLFRIAQEAITNILRHAQATEVIIQLIYEPNLVHLSIQDNGKGFEPQLLINNSFGLVGMQERCDRHNGNLIINSKSDLGTEIIVTMPI